MRKSAEKAFAVSATGHVLLLAIVLQVSQWRPVQRGYPRTITAMLVSKGTGTQAKSSFASTPAGATKAPPSPLPAEPVQKKEQRKKEPPQPDLTQNRSDKKTPSPAVTKKPPKTASAKDTDEGKGAGVQVSSPAASAGSNAARTGGGKIGAGSGTGGVARVDGPAFPFPHYLALLQFRIENQWQPTYLGPGEFLATVHFVVAKNGKILSVELEKSSGNFAFDQAALRAVHNADPLPMLPEGVGMETLGVHFDFVANW
ncbi:MAG: cell envelope integrity protein TolA [bacterium]